MRSTFFVLILAAACGGRDASTPDAPVHHDASIDSPATADASPDSPMMHPDGPVTGAASRVWAFGDFVTNGTLQGGWFSDGDTLPVTATMVPPGTAVFPTPSTTAPYTTASPDQPTVLRFASVHVL